MARSTTTPDPDGPGPLGPRTTEVLHDARGRVVASRVGAEAWTCTTYDARGRVSSRSFPAFGGEPARTASYDHAVGASPLVAKVADPEGEIVTTLDLLGRVVSYRDAAGNVTASTYDQPGRLVRTTGPDPAWSTDTAYDDAGRPLTQKVDGATMATASYAAPGRELSEVNYANATSLADIDRDGAGRRTTLAWSAAGGGPLATDVVVRSQAGRIMSQTLDTRAPDSFGYDAAGRLTSATVGGVSTAYQFAATGGCGPLGGAGRNTNRSRAVVGATTPRLLLRRR